MKHFYRYYPILFLLLFFCLDKLFLHPYFREQFLQDGNVIYYVHRRQLFNRLKKQYPKLKKNLVIAFGDSRAYSYSNVFLREHENDWTIYNFSGPQAVPAYSYYWMEKLTSAGVIPKLVFFVVSPEGFDDKKGLMHKPFLRLGADDSFVIQNWQDIPQKDRNNYLLDKLIALRGLEMDYKLLWTRWRNHNLSQYNPKVNSGMLILNLGNGEQLAYANHVNQPEKLEKDARRMSSIYFYQFEIHKTQFIFTEKLLKLAQKHGTSVILIWPKVYPTYYKKYQALQLDKRWGKKMARLAQKYGMQYIDFNKKSTCKLFYDASHQSIKCFPEQTRLLFELYQKKK